MFKFRDFRSKSIVVAASICATAQVHAAFINGVETFDGTTLDSTTWQPFTSGSASITQDDRLILTRAAGEAADYTALTETVGVGEGVRVDFEIISGTENGSV